MATNFRREIGGNRRHAFLHGTRVHSRWQDGKADGRVNSVVVLPTSCKNLVNFGPLTPEFTVMVWRPFMRQMKVKVARDKNAQCTQNTPAVWTEWNALVADNVAQTAGAIIRSLQRGCLRQDACSWPDMGHAFLVQIILNRFKEMPILGLSLSYQDSDVTIQ